ncbi:MAG TPA: diguanylate cyclase [Chloroflexia bacterium]|nr:diguanylate cyclase [Chloroflexia bacterium]
MRVSSSGSSQPAVVLIIDPEPLNQRAMRDQLMRLGYSARSADDYESAAAILEATPPDVVLLTGVTGAGEGWADLQTQIDNWGLPVLKLAESGAQALPTISDAELRMRLDAALQSRKLHETLVMENARLAAERLYDPITGLFNRRYMMIRVEEEVKRSSRHSYPLSCLLLDIDRFDAVNEAWGHMVGDEVLRNMAHVVIRGLRATDIIARYRDDQFIALLTDTDAEGAQVAANRLRDAVAAHDFVNPTSSDPIKVTASIGVAYWVPTARPGEGTWEPQLIGLAERALRAAKQSGPNRLVMLQAA